VQAPTAPWASQDTTNGFWSTDLAQLSQKIKNTDPITLSRVELLLEPLTVDGGQVHVEVWTGPNFTGTKLGGNSNTATISGVAAWVVFTFASPPVPTGDFFLHLVRE